MTTKKNKILSVLNAFETGSAQGDYGDVTILADGPGNIFQVTYGRSQTTEFGNLKKLISLYASMDGKYSGFFIPYKNRIGRTPSLSKDKLFVETLRKAGDDPVMREAQDSFFDSSYWEPAVKWAKENGFTKSLSLLVIYDSFIQSGRILMSIRNKFAERLPVYGGDEKTWIREYTKARHNWLANHFRPDVRTSKYRTKDLLKMISDENWDLVEPVVANGVLIR